MSTLAAAPSLPGPTSPTDAASRGWLVGPWFDALLIANIAWPLLAFVPISEALGGSGSLQFWQLYYVTTPHRWITLGLVFLDRERFGARRWVFLGLAATAIAVTLGVRITTGALTCLLAVDYLWNAWHFAAQHHGIYRIYGRLGGAALPAGAEIEKWALRGFLLYVILRVATATWSDDAWHERFWTMDWLALLVPAALTLRAVKPARRAHPGGVLYLGSVCALYTSLLWAVHERRLALVLALATASALFHATEYLAVVSWSVRQRHAALGERMGWLGVLAPRWGLALAAFVLILGGGGWLMDQRFLETWLLLNVIVAFLHYAYDGLIWRRSKH